MKKTVMLLGMALCVLGVVGVLATSYFDAEHIFSVKTDQAIILSLDQTETASVTLGEDAAVYSVTAKVAKSSDAGENVNATLRLSLTDESETLTLDAVTFDVYVKDGSAPVKSLTGKGVLEITGINETTEYRIKIYLKAKENGERYTVSELNAIGGKMQVAFTSAGGNA